MLGREAYTAFMKEMAEESYRNCVRRGTIPEDPSCMHEYKGMAIALAVGTGFDVGVFYRDNDGKMEGSVT
jgi:hypothetical protein